MKFFIAGTEIHSDKNLQAGPLENYYELGFESVYTHLLAKRFIKDGTLNPNEDVVVTCEGREFFYNKHIKTISWKEFENIKKTILTFTINGTDFLLNNIFQETEVFHHLYMENGKPFGEFYNKNLSERDNYDNYVKNGTPKYRYFEEDYDIITDLNFNKDLIIPEQKYICFNRRFRKHREEYNMSKDYAIKLMQKLIDEFNVKIFLTGYHNEKFSEYINGVEWVNLRDWCTLLNHNNCFAAVQNQTGTTNLSQIAGKEKLLNIVINNDETMFTNPLYFNGRRPDVLGRAVNFKKLRNIVHRGAEPSIDQIIKEIHTHV
jgi:hypothetical protein